MNPSPHGTTKSIRESRRRALAIGKYWWRTATRQLSRAVTSHAAWSAKAWCALYQPSSLDDER